MFEGVSRKCIRYSNKLNSYKTVNLESGIKAKLSQFLISIFDF